MPLAALNECFVQGQAVWVLAPKPTAVLSNADTRYLWKG